MALQIRRGTNAQRTSVTPVVGELLYTTDTKKLYVGDGTTAGGNPVDTDTTSDLVADTTPQLGGNLDVNGRSITSASNGNITVAPNGTGEINLNANVNVTGHIAKSGSLSLVPTGALQFGSNSLSRDANVYMVRNTYSNTPGAGFTFAQHHNTSDSVNFNFYRTRGTGSASTAVLNGDGLGDITFAGYTSTGPAGAGAISTLVDGAPSAGNVPMKFQFITNNGSALGIRAEITATGVFKTDTIQNLTGSQLNVSATTVSISGNVQLNGQSDLRFADNNSSNWVAFQAPASVGTNVTWTLPAADGTNGQVLTTDGSGTLSWTSIGGISGALLQSRNTVAGTTGSLASLASTDLTISPGHKTYALLSIQTSVAARVILYTDTASRTADSGRGEGVDPSANSGVIAEVVTTGGQTKVISPGVFGFNNEASPTTDIYARVTNKSGGPTTITITLTILKLEV